MTGTLNKNSSACLGGISRVIGALGQTV